MLLIFTAEFAGIGVGPRLLRWSTPNLRGKEGTRGRRHLLVYKRQAAFVAARPFRSVRDTPQRAPERSSVCRRRGAGRKAAGSRGYPPRQNRECRAQDRGGNDRRR